MLFLSIDYPDFQGSLFFQESANWESNRTRKTCETL